MFPYQFKHVRVEVCWKSSDCVQNTFTNVFILSTEMVTTCVSLQLGWALCAVSVLHWLGWALQAAQVQCWLEQAPYRSTVDPEAAPGAR